MYKPTVLIVDDEELNLDILEETLSDKGFNTLLARNGLEGWGVLQAHPEITVIVLDRMMPVMDGMAFVNKLKDDRRYRNIPVIMQTAAAGSEQILQGIKAGVFYYLTKPYEKQTLLNIVGAAIQDLRNLLSFDEPEAQSPIIHMTQMALYSFNTIEEARELSQHVSQLFPDPAQTMVGLSELMMNAIEHGNLGIDFAGKRKLIMDGTWQQHIQDMLKLPEYKSKMATITVERFDDRIEATIRDQGKGFDYKQYASQNAMSVTDLNGRGIAIARLMSFDEVSYLGSGNVVRMIKKIGAGVTPEKASYHQDSVS